MIGTVVFLMCQGEQKRLANLGYPKQLVVVDGTTLLERTIRQIRAYPPTRDAHIEIIGRRAGFDDVGLGMNDPQSGFLMPIRELADPGLCIVDGIRATLAPVLTQNWVPTRWFILLGDVAWSDYAIEQLLADRRDLVFAGTSDVSRSVGEVFGLGFDDYLALAELADTCPCRVGKHGALLSLGQQQRGGHLRRLLWWAMERRGLKPEKRSQTWAPAIYLPIDDGTDDIDTPKDVENIRLLERELESVRCPERHHRKTIGEAAAGRGAPAANSPSPARPTIKRAGPEA